MSRTTTRWIVGLLLLVALRGSAVAQDPFERARRKLVREAVVGSGITDPRVIKSIETTPRHEFVPRALRDDAYEDMALPIGGKQTISSPFIVAYMTQSLEPKATDRVLEIGTGSGYQAAVLSPLVKDVYTIEIVESLGRNAEQTLQRLRYDNVHVKVGDGFKGWPEFAPFDKIIVTCSPEDVPVPLAEQLREGGLMVIPVGERYQQTLYLFRKENGELKAQRLRPTLFVPMTGRAESNREVQPDPLHPRIVNGDFEMESETQEPFIEGWYYQRHATRVPDVKAPQGEHYLQLSNDRPGRSSHVLQGFAIDGRSIGFLDVSAWVQSTNVRRGRDINEASTIAISFYDENRRDLGARWIGPFRGSTEWHRVGDRFRVPIQTREAILRVGLFGATGEIRFDDIIVKPLPR